MGRLTIIDGFRGFFLFFMAQHHFNSILNVPIGKINHEYFGWVDVAQGFIFVSGLVVGLVYGKKFIRDKSIAPPLRRARMIYFYQASLIFILLAATLLLGAGSSDELRSYLMAPMEYTFASLLLITASPHMGILPMYIFYLLVTPLAFRLLARGWTSVYFLILAGVWMWGQTGLTELIGAHLAAFFGMPFTLGFNIFGWQVLFFTGLYFGFRMNDKGLDLDFLKQDQYRVSFLIALAVIFLLGLFDRVVGWDLAGLAYSASFNAQSDRGTLAWIYVIAFALDVFAIVWLLTAGAVDRAPAIRWMSGALTWIFTLRPLVFLGKHSLHVFSFHVLMFYVLAQVIPPLGLSQFQRSTLMIGALASLWLAAWGHAWLQARDAARPDPSASATVKR